MHLEPAVRAEFALLREAFAVARGHNVEVRVLDHLNNIGLGSCEVIGETLQVPLQPING